MLNEYLKKHNILYNGNPEDLRPDWSGIFAYGAKAFPLMTKHKRGKMKIHFKTNPRAHIGYLMGYQATNIYRIWVPKLREVITTRDVTFQEDQFFNPDNEETGIPVAEYRPAAEILRMPDFQPFDSPFGTTLGEDLEESIGEDLEEYVPSPDRASEPDEPQRQSSGGGEPDEARNRPLTPTSMPDQTDERAKSSGYTLVGVVSIPITDPPPLAT